MKIRKILLSLALSGAMVLGLMPSMTMTALAAENSTDYTVTIPATLTVASSGWNDAGGITAAVKSGDTFDSGKKLTVTAASTNSWALKSGDNSVGYNLATATGTYSSTAEIPSWEFSATELNTSGGTTKDMGIIVDDYSAKPAGTYQDTVTFTASVENAGISVSSVTINNAPTEALFVNSTGTLTATVLPNEASDKTVTWSSSDPDIISINESTGEYTVKAYGSATITVTAGVKTDTCTITGKVTYTSISLGTVIHVGDTLYNVKYMHMGDKDFSFSNTTVTLIENNGNYQFKRSNGTIISGKIKIQSNTDGVYVSGGSGTNANKWILSAHTN